MTDTGALIEQIQSEALNGGSSLGDLLRKCIALGAEAGSEDLVDWATHELRGYIAEGDGPPPEVPGYRIVAAPIVIDGVLNGQHFTQMQISPVELPEPARDIVKEQVELRSGVGELEEMVRRAREDQRRSAWGCREGRPGRGSCRRTEVTSWRGSTGTSRRRWSWGRSTKYARDSSS